MTALSLPSRYSDTSLLGEGGSGRVYRARDSIRDRELALKLVTPAESTWLRREFDTLRQIRHENLIQVFDWGSLDSGEAYYTMELIEGEDWAARMAKVQPQDEVRRILTGLLRGLAHLHCHGEVHGDLKPGNILLGRGTVVKVTDVGMGGGGTASKLSGTPGYAAPEVWEGANADLRSDLYSVGVMAYEALTGVHPFSGRTLRDVVSGQLEGWVPSPGAHGVRVPADLERVVMRALERDPALRQGSADEFMEGMEIEDRIGEILGGKFVGREEELRRAVDVLFSDDSCVPTLLYVEGPEGSGKESLIEELAHRVISLDGVVLRFEVDLDDPGSPQSDVSELVSGERQLSVSRYADALRESGERSPTLVIARLGQLDLLTDRLRATARHIWAVTQAGERSGKVLLVNPRERESDVPVEDFESRLTVPPYTVDQVGLHIEGTLGRSTLEPELVKKIHTITGGNPGLVGVVVGDLVRRRLLQRMDGAWKFVESEKIQTLQVPGVADRWAASWDGLGSTPRRLLASLSLVSGALTLDQITAVGTAGEKRASLEALRARGWVQESGDRWGLASEAIRKAIVGRMTAGLRREVGLQLLSGFGGPIGREDRAALMLELEPGPEAVTEGLWSVRRLMARGNYREALERLDSCENVADSHRQMELLRQALLLRGAALHQTGNDDAAAKALESHRAWIDLDEDSELATERGYQWGIIAASQSKYDEARNHFLRAIRSAEKQRNTTTLLRSHAQLSEIDWRYGDESAREAAMIRVREVLAGLGSGAPADARASLTYQLGAALILAGRRSDAEDVLLEAIRHEPGDFWRMRIATALGAASYYQGKFQDSIGWLNEAWAFAEKGGFDAYKARILCNQGGLSYGSGRFREALKQHVLSTQWARRTGNMYELIAARAGASINLTMLGRYEEAVGSAREAQHVARQLQNDHEVAKAMELEALALYQIGNYEGSSRLIEVASTVVQTVGFDDIKPRLDWLAGRIEVARGRLENAEQSLLRAHGVLLRTKDWEDLPGVEIELERLRAHGGDPTRNVAEIVRLVDNAEAKGAVVVVLHGALALAQILATSGLRDPSSEGVVTRVLALAEQVGATEYTWRLSMRVGEIAQERGQVREANSRFAHALRSLREVADRLTAANRKFYLNTAHAVSALSKLSATSSPP
jgi:serine/threonine protein kinase/tetratricopeptide (TPR) repeat protein